MCDEETLRDEEAYLRRSGSLTRRAFGALSIGTGLGDGLAADRRRTSGDGR